MTLAVVVVVFGALIFFHEFGHFLVARGAGVRVDEFSLGFGPRVFGLRRGETAYNLRLVPLGGFVRLAGLYPARPGDEPPPGKSFQDKTVAQRLGVIAAGPGANLILAFLLFTAVLAVFGVSRPTLVIGRVQPDSAAAAAGILPGDRVLAVDGRPVGGWLELQRAIAGRPESRLRLTLARDGGEVEVTLVPRRLDGHGFAGIAPVMEKRRSPLWRAVPEGLAWTGGVLALTWQGLLAAVRGEGMAEVLGPVGIGQQIGEATRLGLDYLLTITAVISVNLAFLNLLPIPALDGSRIAFLAVEAVRRKPIDAEKEGFVHFVGFALLLLLLLVVTYRDLLRLMGGSG